MAVPELGRDEGMVMVFIRSCYGLKSSGALCNSIISKKKELGYFLCKADYDIWFRPVTAQHVLVFADHIIHTYHNTGSPMKNIDNIYGLKPDFIIEPNRYLGTNVGT